METNEMDAFGCMQVTKEDANEVKLLLREGYSPVVFALTGGDGGAMIILMVSTFTKLGQMPFGGNPDGRIYVGVYGTGCNHLGMESQHPNYISEKLSLGKADAQTFAAFWDLIWT